MPSSTSSSELPSREVHPYRRVVPEMRLGLAWFVAAIVFVAGMIAWEAYWRGFGAYPSYRNSDALWAMQRRRINQGEGNATVLIGSSRVLFDIQLPVWERFAGDKPIQLSFEGTSPIFMLEDLADEPKFANGRLLVGITPPLFFTAMDLRAGAIKYAKGETPSHRAGQWLSMMFIEPFFAFYDQDFALMTVLKRQPWPLRAGVSNFRDIRKLSVNDAERNTRMWEKVEHDPEYNALTKKNWTQFFAGPPPGTTPESMKALVEQQIARAAAAVAKLRARGVNVVFARLPSDGPFYEFEQKAFPRPLWDALLEATGAPGVHFEDYPELQGYFLPEWSHLNGPEADRFTAAFYPILEREHGWTRR
jgi:hypothetical protein